MKISELIKHLNQLKDKHGDLPVYILSDTPVPTDKSKKKEFPVSGRWVSLQEEFQSEHYKLPERIAIW